MTRLFEVDAVLTPDDLPFEVVRPEFDEAKHKYTYDGKVMPSVTTILGVLDKPALPWWGMTIGVEGVLELLRNGTLDVEPSDVFGYDLSVSGTEVYSVADVVKLLTQHKLTVNHVKDNAGKRGSTAHDIAERFVKTGEAPDMAQVPDEAESYVRSAADFLVGPGSSLRFVGSEVMVWSPEDWFAGTFDGLVYDENDRLGLIDYKTSKRAYDTHVIQLAAYERARRVLKLDPVDFLAVVHISGEGYFDPSRHWFEVSGREIDTSIRDFLSIKQTYDRMQGRGKRLKDLHKSMNPKAR